MLVNTEISRHPNTADQGQHLLRVQITQQPGYGLAQILGLLIAPPGLARAIGSRCRIIHHTPSC